VSPNSALVVDWDDNRVEGLSRGSSKAPVVQNSIDALKRLSGGEVWLWFLWTDSHQCPREEAALGAGASLQGSDSAGEQGSEGCTYLQRCKHLPHRC
jgi:hypothetical protein